ncbi:MAG: CCA tRNA nucleotidyltransferase [Nitrosopumilaceae archaeon]
MKVVNVARKQTIPSQKEKDAFKKIADFSFDLIKKETSKYSEVTAVEFGGSYAKGTWLPKTRDLDIFVKFKESIDSKKFESLGIKIGFDSLKKFKPYVRYAEHPYVEAIVKGARVNVVPCYNVQSGRWKSAADRSPFHTKFITKLLDQQKKNEVRLLKKFLMGKDLYGAEIAKQAFSGYVTEVLVLHYGSFLGVIKAAANFKQSQVIGKPTKKFESPLVIVDPIDSNRNLGAAISTESVGRFVLLSRAFLKNPSIFLNSKTKSRKNLENALVVIFNYKKRSPDIIWGQIKRAVNAATKQLELAGFNVLRKTAALDEKSQGALLFLLQSTKIEKTMVRSGPDFFKSKDSDKFIAKNSKKSRLMWINDEGKILSLQQRPENDAKQFLQNLLKSRIKTSGIPSGLLPDFKKGFKIQTGRQLTSKSIKEALLDLVSTDGLAFRSS